MPGERAVTQSEVIRAILLEDSPCCRRRRERGSAARPKRVSMPCLAGKATSGGPPVRYSYIACMSADAERSHLDCHAAGQQPDNRNPTAVGRRGREHPVDPVAVARGERRHLSRRRGAT